MINVATEATTTAETFEAPGPGIFDLDDDGKPETLRLLFATPKRWRVPWES